MKPRDSGELRRRIDDVITRFVDGHLSFEPAVSELTPLFRTWLEQQNTEEELEADAELFGSDRPMFIARDYFPIAKGRSEEERKRAMELVNTILMRALADGAA